MLIQCTFFRSEDCLLSFCHLIFFYLVQSVLSIAKALSIQAHPDKGLASRLHESRQDVYKDDNHKPEMALAITEFEALCGFISVKELKDVLQSVPEIRELVGDAYVSQILDFNSEDQEENHVKAQVKSLFTQLMSARKDMISDALSKLKGRLKLKDEERQTSREGNSSPCSFRISSEGLLLLLPHITKQILHASPSDFKHLLQYKSVQFVDFVDAEFGDKAPLPAINVSRFLRIIYLVC
ncbi:hypothetical protein Dimus_008364 [Dionaea muscipula]